MRVSPRCTLVWAIFVSAMWVLTIHGPRILEAENGDVASSLDHKGAAAYGFRKRHGNDRQRRELAQTWKEKLQRWKKERDTKQALLMEFKYKLGKGDLHPPLPFRPPKVDYHSCEKSLRKHLGGGPHATTFSHIEHIGGLKDILWQHFPKCGSSFSLTVHNYVCTQAGKAKHYERLRKSYGDEPSEPYDINPSCWYCGDALKRPNIMYTIWGRLEGVVDPLEKPFCRPDLRVIGDPSDHDPVDRDWYEEESISERFIVANFRDPRDRLISAYNQGKQTVGISHRSHKLVDHKIKKSNLTEYLHDFPMLKGCQTKMILGYRCNSDHVLSRSDIERAKEIVRNRFAFVGIGTMFNASVCLFHHKYGGILREQEMTFHIHDGTKKYMEDLYFPESHGSTPYAKKEDWKLVGPMDDPADWEIYNLALKIFVSDLLKYDIISLDDIDEQFLPILDAGGYLDFLRR